MKTMSVVGAGTMGWGIAQVFAGAGWQVLLCDQKQEWAQRGKDAMEAALQRQVKKGRLTEEEKKATLDRVLPKVLSECKDCELVIEAIFENMQAKQEVFLTLEKQHPPETVFASNTSSLSITEMASKLQDPSRVAGMHFFNPATAMELVEVVAGAYTSEETLAFAMDVAREVGKTPVRVQESVGFVVNRVLLPLINEGVALLAEGIASAEDIDTALRLGANHPMGPLALGDLVGLDVCLTIMETMQAEIGDKYSPHPLLRKMVRAGKLGRKTGQGFYSYKD